MLLFEDITYAFHMRFNATDRVSNYPDVWPIFYFYLLTINIFIGTLSPQKGRINESSAINVV